jgi:transcriptional regulator with XRE-family HTH domain
MRNVRLPGDMIRHYRIKAGMTQQELGVRAGFSESSAGVRIAQYESATETLRRRLRADCLRPQPVG